MRRIVFIGNCQIGALSRLYRSFVGFPQGDDVRYLTFYNQGSNQGGEEIADADIVVSQVFDFAVTDPVLERAPTAQHFQIPVASANFLWPFGGRQHPRNEAVPFLETGPYPAELGDTYLNRAMSRGVEADRAYADYVSLDLSSRVNLDRLHEIWHDQQTKRDEATGIAIAPIVERYFRHEMVFWTPYHPEMRVFSVLMDGLFARMGVDRSTVDRMRASLPNAPFPMEALPIHPLVARHFGITWATADTRYKFLHEGAFTFEEYCRRYMNFTWNAALMEGVFLSGSDQLARAAELLRRGLNDSPASVAGHRALSFVLQRMGNFEAALAAAERSLAIDPLDQESLVQRGRLLMRSGASLQAEESFGKATSQRPVHAESHVALAEFLSGQDRMSEAAVEMSAAISLKPTDAHLHAASGHIWSRAGNFEEAIRCFERAVAIEPEQPAFREAVADLLIRTGKLEEAKHHLKSALSRGERAHSLALLSRILLRDGQIEESEANSRKAITLAPNEAWFHCELATVLKSQDRYEEAIAALGMALRIEPTAPHIWAALGHARWQKGYLPEAELCFRHCVTLDPTFKPFGEALDTVLTQSRQLAQRERGNVAHPRTEMEGSDAGPRGIPAASASVASEIYSDHI